VIGPDRPTLVLDAAYFARELERRLVSLERVEGDGRVRSDWQQAAGLARRIRGRLRDELDRERRRKKLEARKAAVRA